MRLRAPFLAFYFRHLIPVPTQMYSCNCTVTSIHNHICVSVLCKVWCWAVHHNFSKLFQTPNRCCPCFHSTLPVSFPFFLSQFSLILDKKEDIAPAVVMPAPSKRGRKSKQVMSRVAGVGGVLPPGSDALILAHLAAGGQVNFLCSFFFPCFLL